MPTKSEAKGVVYKKKRKYLLQMAEAFPEEQSCTSVLILATKWKFDTYGLSTVNKSLVNNLRLLDPEGKYIKITCAVLEDDGKIKEADIRDATEQGVQLRGAQRPRGSKRGKKPKLKWLDQDIIKYYLHLVLDKNYDFIVGHAPYVANGCLTLKEFYKDRHDSPTTILMFHSLPKDEVGDVDNEVLLDWLTGGDIVFSLGKIMEAELTPYIASQSPGERPIHKLYIPSYPLDRLDVKNNYDEIKVWGTQHVSVMTGEIKDLDINGLDFPMVVTATAEASEHIRNFDGVRIKLCLLIANEEERAIWKEMFEELLYQRNLNHTGLSFQVELVQTAESIKIHMRKSNLFLLPLKKTSPLFGVEALEAIAAAVPVLISKESGLAAVLETMAENEPVVYGNQSQSIAQTWTDRIIHKLVKPEEAQRVAVKLREQFLFDTNVARTHLNFIHTITDSACIKLKMEIQTDPHVSEENIKTAIKFGVASSDVMDTKKYIIAFMRRLLVQREKVEMNLLEKHLNPRIAKLWKEVLSSLEKTNRKLLNIQEGSLIFTLFCPTNDSLQQLQDEMWTFEILRKVDKLLKGLGVEAQSRWPVELKIVQQTQEMKKADLDAKSIGYEIKATLSDTDSQNKKEKACF